jgi:hypothetical protein
MWEYYLVVYINQSRCLFNTRYTKRDYNSLHKTIEKKYQEMTKLIDTQTS